MYSPIRFDKMWIGAETGARTFHVSQGCALTEQYCTG